MNACVHTYTKSQTPSTRRRGPGWRIHGSVEDTKLSTNKQHSLSAQTRRTPTLCAARRATACCFDSIQCDGPFVCNLKTCAEKNEAGPKACPLVMEANDPPLMRKNKREEKCVSCKDCGHLSDHFENGAYKNKHYEHWGAGCARECSKLICADQEIWDWTQKKCSPCSELRDAWLCSKRNWVALHLETRSVHRFFRVDESFRANTRAGLTRARSLNTCV
jgi:hypothetical protein